MTNEIIKGLTGSNPSQGLEYLSRELNLPNYKNDNSTILIIDEIQNSSKIYNRLRDLDTKLKCDIIVTGSYLAHTLNKEYFHPAGNLKLLTLYPLSFMEFCEVFSYKQKVNELFLTKDGLLDLNKNRILEDDILNKFYLLYLEIGGQNI